MMIVSDFWNENALEVCLSSEAYDCLSRMIALEMGPVWQFPMPSLRSTSDVSQWQDVIAQITII